MITVEVTQFMRPDGQQVQHALEIDSGCTDKYKEITEYGLRLTCEQLMSGKVSQTIESPDFDFDITLTNGDNLEENKKALERMILRFDKAAYIEMDNAYNMP